MTVAALPAIVEYAEDGVTRAFPVPFRFKSADDLVVERLVAGAVATLTLGADYSVAGGTTDNGGTVTRTAATNGAILRIRRVTQRAQPMEYPTGGRFPAESHEAALDRLTLIAQEQDADQADISARALMVAPGEKAVDLPLAALRAGSALAFDSVGQPIALPIGSFPAGPTGASNNTYTTLAKLQQAPVTNRSYSFAPDEFDTSGFAAGPFYFEPGDVSAGTYDADFAAGVRVKLNDVSRTIGALVRPDAGSLTYQARGARSILRPAAVSMSDATQTPKDKGALGNGASPAADQAGMARAVADTQGTGRFIPGIDNSYWTHPQDTIFLPAGVYDAGDLAFIGNITTLPAIQLRGEKGQTVIRVPDGKYAITSSQRIARMEIEGITFVGGKGAVQLTHTGVNVAGMMRITDCYFENYTECAIGNNATDAPYLHVEGCIFMGKQGADTIGIAWGGYADLVRIVGNSFLRNKYHIKLGPYLSGSTHIRENDFIRWGGGGSFGGAIWIVPNSDAGSFGSNSGNGTILSGNKFGNENLEPYDIRILVAKEGAGDNRQVRHHDTTWYPDNCYLTGVTIENSRVACNDGTMSPFMRSYIGEVRNIAYRNNRHDGGRHTVFCEFAGQRRCDYANMNWSFELSAADTLSSASPFVYGVANSLVGLTNDRSGVLGYDASALLHPSGGDDTGHIELMRGDRFDNIYLFNSATDNASKIAEADSLGAAGRAATVTAPAGTGVAIGLSNVAGNQTAFVSLDLKRAPTSSVEKVLLRVKNFALGIDVLMAQIVLPPVWRRMRVPIIIPDTAQPNAWQVVLEPINSTGGANQFSVGRVYAHHGREATRDGHLRTLGDGAWDGGHLVMGTTHIWESGGKLYIKKGAAPTGPTDGAMIGATA